MKLRIGFVSNSSSSSYICEVCSEAQSGYDASLSDLGLIECENNHIICESHLKKQVMSQIDIYTITDADGNILLKESVCPICKFEHLSIHDEILFYRKKLKTDNKKTLREIKEKYKNYEDFIGDL